MSDLTLKNANLLYRKGKYEEALKIYEHLNSVDPKFSTYFKNIEMTKRKLEIGKYSNKGVSEPGKKVVKVNFLQVLDFALPINQVLDKLCFYISPLENSLVEINIYLNEIEFQNLDRLVIVGFENLSKLFQKINFLRATSCNKDNINQEDNFNSILYVYDIQVLSEASKPYHSFIREFQKKNSAWRIHDDVQYHGSFYLKSMEEYFDSSAAISRLKEYLIKLKSHPNSERCIVAGTGPSLKYAYSLDELGSSIVITCNSALRNKTLMSVLQPHIVCATDPIFHAGWGQYASEFRNVLLERMREFNFILIVPTRDYHIYYRFLPIDLHSRLCCYQLENLENFNINLIDKAEVKSTPNVLTNIMLPLAASLSRQISIIGCDGKKESSNYFWGHDPSSQINQHMVDIQKEFKGFFNIDYDKYYSDHCNSLNELLIAMEAIGIQISSRSPSYIPCLLERESIPNVVQIVDQNFVDVTIIMPARDASEYIFNTLLSVESAAVKANIKVRVVLIDDASIDESDSIAINFSSSAVNTELVVINAPGLGVSGARNIGLGYINSEYVCFLDSDDLFSEDSLLERIRILDGAELSIIGSFSKTLLTDIDSGLEMSTVNNYKKTGRIYTYKDVATPAHISSILYRSDAISTVRFDYGRNYGEDWLFLAQVLANGGGLIFTEKSHTVYSIHSESATKRNAEQHILALFDVLRIVFSGHGLGARSDSIFSKGLTGLSISPNYSVRKASLFARLMGAMLVRRQFPSSVNIIASLQEKGIIDADVLFELDRNFESHASIIKREIERFSCDLNISVYERLLAGLGYLRVPELAPRLYSCMFKGVNNEPHK